MFEQIRSRRRHAAAGLAAAAVVGCALGAAVIEGHTGAVQRDWRPAPETWHWVLPAQHDGVEVAELHPGDCYVIQEADGLVYFGEPRRTSSSCRVGSATRSPISSKRPAIIPSAGGKSASRCPA